MTCRQTWTRLGGPRVASPRPWLVMLGVMFMGASDAVGQGDYQKPPAPIDAILATPLPPTVSLSPTRDRVALISTERYPSIAELAEPMVRLAGLRINPITNGRAREGRITGITFKDLAGGADRPLVTPPGEPLKGLHSFQWSPDGVRFSVLNSAPGGSELFIGDATTGQLDRMAIGPVNTIFGGVDWASPTTLLVWTIPGQRGPAPTPVAAPTGPVIQQSSGKPAPVRTYQDLLTNADDEALFTYYTTSHLMLLDVTDSSARFLSQPGIIPGADLSPDGQYILVTRLKKPFSYLHPYSAFPRTIEVLDRKGALVRTVADLPLQDAVPIEGVPIGPRGVRWLPTQPSTLFYTQALDGGDPRTKVPHRDELFTQDVPFVQVAKSVGKTEHRFSGINSFESGDVLITDYDRDRRWTRTVKRSLTSDAKPLVIFDRSAQDRYGDPGSPLLRMLPNGRSVIRTQGDKLWLSGRGANPTGERPFLALYDPVTKTSEKVFESQPGRYESASLLDDTGKSLLIRRESPTEPGNYYLKTGESETALTNFVEPYPDLRKVKKELVTCQRPDGVTISFTLYTPPEYTPGQPLPTVFWAYPREFNSAADAGQVSGSPDRFVTLAGYTHLFFLTQGYAVMDEVSVPIVGPPESANDTFVEQLSASAKAAIDKAVEMGVVDRNRIGVGGHSYGAFMTANLLAHTDYFRAGIARSGAYNRTLTPFGFQNERRTFWEAPDVYAKMSPFHNATKINEPLLLIHGQADANPGTFPVQSERMYQAVRGVGGTVRLVLLPHEDHGYRAAESIGHVLAESVAWFDQHVKNAAPRSGAPGTDGQ